MPVVPRRDYACGSMPTLADLDAPPRSRGRDLILGVLIALPVVLFIAYLTLPMFIGTIRGEANEYDQRLRQEDAYLQTVCSELLNMERDETLCECVLAVEFPSLDCRGPFLRWSLDRHAESCSDDAVRKQSISFCACVDAVHERVSEAEAAGDEGLARQEEARTAKCIELDDAFSLPDFETLVATAPPTPAAAESE